MFGNNNSICYLFVDYYLSIVLILHKRNKCQSIYLLFDDCFITEESIVATDIAERGQSEVLEISKKSPSSNKKVIDIRKSSVYIYSYQQDLFLTPIDFWWYSG